MERMRKTENLTRPLVTGNLEAVRPAAWKRWLHLAHLAFFGMLFAIVGWNEVMRGGSWYHHGAMAALAFLWCIWYWFMLVRHPQWWRRVGLMLCYNAGALLLLGALVWLNSACWPLVYLFYPQVFAVLPLGWAIPVGLLAGGLHVGMRYVLDQQPLGFLLLNVALALVVYAVVTTGAIALVQLHLERNALQDELRITRKKLAEVRRRTYALEDQQRQLRTVHDNLTQGLISIVMHLAVADKMMPRNTYSGSRQHVEQARSVAREKLADVRRWLKKTGQHDALPPELPVTEELELISSLVQEEKP
uniref:Signal transduction histidine kinase subgroup 3 dimerisation and phosphoacceptor domain-containing protein n=1 Tax=Thermosporothrix sp. COM3 TaxID=2490863 RepID=A0A455SK67_9CHLR|nr:hypothetical protein KTC_35280 [Thermosporothrix sp. COM3]